MGSGDKPRIARGILERVDEDEMGDNLYIQPVDVFNASTHPALLSLTLTSLQLLQCQLILAPVVVHRSLTALSSPLAQTTIAYRSQRGGDEWMR